MRIATSIVLTLSVAAAACGGKSKAPSNDFPASNGGSSMTPTPAPTPSSVPMDAPDKDQTTGPGTPQGM